MVAIEAAENRIPDEAWEALHKLARDWTDAAYFHALEVVPLMVAVTNEIFQIKWPITAAAAAAAATAEEKVKTPRHVLVRIYGEGMDTFFDRENEIRTFECMSKHGQGPKLLARFDKGRVEEFIHARTLSASADLRDEDISARISSKLREFHELDMPGDRKVLLWDRLRNWIAKATELCSAEEAKEFRLDAIGGEIAALEKELAGDDRIGFCHNDLHCGNLMIDEETKVVTIIDYEYAGFNPVAYDFANHFCGMAGDCHSDKPHILDYSKYPDVEERRRFIQNYLSSSGEQPDLSEVEDLLLRAEKYALASHLAWGLWGLISKHVNEIDFDCIEFARQRFQQYWLRKPVTLHPEPK